MVTCLWQFRLKKNTLYCNMHDKTAKVATQQITVAKIGFSTVCTKSTFVLMLQNFISVMHCSE